MSSEPLEQFRHEHVFLGAQHDRNARRTWAVIALTTAMMVVEIVGGPGLPPLLLTGYGLNG